MNVTLGSEELLKYFKCGNDMIRFAYQKSLVPGLWGGRLWGRAVIKLPQLYGRKTMGLWLGAVMVGMDRGLALFASVINVTKYITEPFKGGRIHLGSWFLTSFSPQWWGESSRIPGDGSCGKNGLQGVNQESVRKLEPQKGITSESRPLVT